MRRGSLRGWVLPFTLYPLLLGGSLALALALLARGTAPPSVVLLVQVVAAAVVAGMERVVPYARAWRRPRRDRLTDALHLVASSVVATAVVRALALGALTALAARSSWLPACLSPLCWLLPDGVAPRWPAAWPLGLQLALALCVAELGGYFSHRLLHRSRRLFALHAVHHSALRLYWLNASRNHPLDTALSIAASTLPLLLLQPGDTVFALFSVYTGTHLLLQHANVDVRTGPLNLVLSTAEVHRWHHSRRPEEANGNYGHVLLIWDLLFRTRICPADRRPPLDIGLCDAPEAYPTGYLGQLLAPLRAVRARSGGGAP